MNGTSRRLRVRPVIGLEALPDDATRARITALDAVMGAGLRGDFNRVGYDRGDPAYTLGGAVTSVAAGQPAGALAASHAGPDASAKPTPTIADGTALNDPSLAGYQLTLLSRLKRS